MASPVLESINFAKAEDDILQLWKKFSAFETSLKQSRNRRRYSFYDGPPFATGMPHYGHILAGTIKDIVTRFAHMKGFFVDRRFGWDCHGLPVEYEIDKLLGITGPEDVAKMGVDVYNNECRKIVMRYSSEWRDVVTRMGRWIDFDNDYKTLYPSFMESVWWVFKQLYDKGLVYHGNKVMPFSTACHTPLSNFEANQNYKDVNDPAVIVSFPLLSDPNVALIAWTTTPWTLPSNLALCVHPELVYVKIRDNATQSVYIMMEARLSALFKSDSEYTVLDRMKGKALENLEYQPIFPYFENRRSTGAFRVLNDRYVTSDSGTGVVQQAPYFGVDDNRVCLRDGVIAKDGKIVCPVDETGRFTEEVVDYAGMFVKDADKLIMKSLKSRGRLVHQSSMNHSYPFCWRSETPLIYKAVPSWFIRVEQMSERLLANNKATYWVPEFVKEKRFANWLREARDWAVSRDRYWGTPIPLWVSADGEEVVCVGSIAELERLSGVRVSDLHREVVDGLTIPSARPGGEPLRRISAVFDCWFESGSMPYAQAHYPFENKESFEECFPADFIAEGVDQTRGWFYTLLVLSTALFDKPPFKNLIVNGLVLASDGTKMSKRLRNYPDPMEVVHKYGADALRLYLINSPVVRADTLRFKEEGVKDVLKDVFLPWYNAYRFLIQNYLGLEVRAPLVIFSDTSKLPANPLDRWILSFTQSLIAFVHREMEAYRLYTVVPRLVKFIESLTNWYVRFSRRRLKGDTNPEDQLDALQTLFNVVYLLCRIMAPFTPFLTELMFQNLRHLLPEVGQLEFNSVHYESLPQPVNSLINKHIEGCVASMQLVIELGRVARDRRTLPIKYPLRELIVIHKDKQCLSEVSSMVSYITEELNIKSVSLSADKGKFGVVLKAEPNYKTLGSRLKGDMKKVANAVKDLSEVELETFQVDGEMVIEGYMLTSDDVSVKYAFDVTSSDVDADYEAVSGQGMLVLLDVKQDQSMVDEGVAREIVSRVQKLRKKAHLLPSDEITVYCDTKPKGGYLDNILTTHLDYLETALKQPVLQYPVDTRKELLVQEIFPIQSNSLSSGADKSMFELDVTLVRGRTAEASGDATVYPYCKFVNLELRPPRGAVIKATVLLENPAGGSAIDSVTSLISLAGDALGVVGVRLYTDMGCTNEIGRTTDVIGLHGSILYATCR